MVDFQGIGQKKKRELKSVEFWIGLGKRMFSIGDLVVSVEPSWVTSSKRRCDSWIGCVSSGRQG